MSQQPSNKEPKSSHKRSIVKAIFYRAVSVIIVGIISYLVTGSFASSSKISIAFVFIETAWYYVNERLWIRIKWGKEGLSSSSPVTRHGLQSSSLEAKTKE